MPAAEWMLWGSSTAVSHIKLFPDTQQCCVTQKILVWLEALLFMKFIIIVKQKHFHIKAEITLCLQFINFSKGESARNKPS